MNDCVIHPEISGGGVMAHRAFFHDVDALARLQRQGDVLFDEEDRDVFLVQHVDDIADLRHHSRHQTFGGFIEQDDLRLQHHCPRNRKHLLLATRQRATSLVATFAKHREIVEHLVEQSLLFLVAHTLTIEPCTKVFHHGQ